MILSSTIEAIQSVSKSEPSHCRFTKILKGLLRLQKDIPGSTTTGLNDIQLVVIYKRQDIDKLMTRFYQSSKTK